TDLARAVGQMIVSGFPGTSVPADLRKRIHGGHLRGVILMGANLSSAAQGPRLTAALQAAANRAGGPPPLVGPAQEGGPVKRFTSFPPSSSAQAMGAAGASVARSQGVATGRALHGAGVTVDFAPVADVRRRRDSFLGSRAFGTTAGAVRADACA